MAKKRSTFAAPFKFEQSTMAVTSRTASRQARLQQDTYFRVLRLIQDNPDMTQRELAQALGVSAGGLHYCLRALIDKGWVKVRNFRNSNNRSAYMYLLTPSGIRQKAVLTQQFLERKLEEYAALRAEIEALGAAVETRG